MTYGWAILIIAVVLGALYQMGVFNSSSSTLRAPPGACKVLRTSAATNLVGQCSGLLPKYVAQFNGQNSKVNVPSNAKFYGNSLTISLWLETYDWGNSAAIGTSPSGTYNWMIYRNQGETQGRLDFLAYYTNTLSAQGGLIPGYSGFGANTWYHVVMVMTSSGSTATVQGYSNGVQQATSTVSDFQSWYQDTTRPLGIGSSATSYYMFNGLISNVQIYNISLDTASISKLYQEGIGGVPVNPQYLVGWWPLNGDTNDYSGNNNNGAPTAITYTAQYGK